VVWGGAKLSFIPRKRNFLDKESIPKIQERYANRNHKPSTSVSDKKRLGMPVQAKYKTESSG
jgi:hypothetical protein